MIPDYLNYLLTGVMKNEYTNATTTQLVSAETQDWDYELMDMLGIPKEMFGAIAMPKTPRGCTHGKDRGGGRVPDGGGSARDARYGIGGHGGPEHVG